MTQEELDAKSGISDENENDLDTEEENQTEWEEWEDEDNSSESNFKEREAEIRRQVEKEMRKKYLAQVNKTKSENERLKRWGAVDIDSIVEQKLQEKESQREIVNQYWEETWKHIQSYRQKAPWLSIADASKIVLFDKVQTKEANPRGWAIVWKPASWLRKDRQLSELSKEELQVLAIEELKSQWLTPKWY